MIPVLQQFPKHDPANGIWGDCHRAAIASILELPIEDVPHFAHGGDGRFWSRETAFLESRGLAKVNVIFTAPLADVLAHMAAANPGVYYVLGGKSVNGHAHSVVGCGGEIVHSPNGAAIVGPLEDGFFWLSFLIPLGCVNPSLYERPDCP